MTATPLTDAEFAAALGPLLPEPGSGPLALAVSGGRDSMALLYLAARYAAPRGRALIALTVDHGLRAESAREAETVGQAARALAVPHRTLVWREVPRGNLEAAAREARYRLMAEACAEAGAGALLIGHTEDDQAETVLMRLARGSGVDGLSAMAPRLHRLGVLLLRPLLAVPRARLEARLRADRVGWLDDPMNEDRRFARVRIRKAADVLGGAGLTPRRLAQTARHMARARVALEAASDALETEAARTAPEGYACLDPARLIGAPEEIGLRLLTRLLMRVGGLAFPPRFEALERLYGVIRAGGVGRGRTLGGCRILQGPDGLMILREAADVEPARPLSPGRALLWDGRFRVRLGAQTGAGAAQVRALGADGIRALRRTSPDTSLARIPSAVRATLPSLWITGRLAAIPHLGYAAPRFGPAALAFEARFAGL